MRTIAIVFGDNDFDNTFRFLLHGLKPILEYFKGCYLTQASVESIIRHNVTGYYVGYQNPLASQEHIEKISKYLMGAKILFDGEAEKDISSKDHGGGAWYLEIQSGVVSDY